MALTKPKQSSFDISAGSLSSAQIKALGIETASFADLAVTVDKANLAGVSYPGFEEDVALLGFKVASNGSLGKYNLVDQAVDAFEDASGVDASASTNEYRDSSGKYYSGKIPATGGTVTTHGSYTVHSFLSTGNTNFVVGAAGNVDILLVGGGGAGTSWTSGSVTRVSENGTANTGGGGGGAGGNNDSNPSGSGGSGIVVVRYPTGNLQSIGNMTLVSNSTTAQAAPTKGDIVMTYSNEAGTAVINTDITAEFSADNGSTWTAMTLASQGTTGGHTILSAHDVTRTSTSGTSMRYRIKTLTQSASKLTRVHAVSLGWS